MARVSVKGSVSAVAACSLALATNNVPARRSPRAGSRPGLLLSETCSTRCLEVFGEKDNVDPGYSSSNHEIPTLPIVGTFIAMD